MVAIDPTARAVCTSVTSNDRRLRVDGTPRIGWHVIDIRSHRELAHYLPEPGLDAFTALQRWLRQEEASHEHQARNV